MSLEDEARQMIQRQQQLEEEEAARQEKLAAPVVLDWGLDLARYIERAGHEPLPLYEQQGPPKKDSRHSVWSVTDVRSLGLKGWLISTSWLEDSSEWEQKESGVLTTIGTLLMGGGSHNVASGITTYTGVLEGDTDFFTVGRPRISEGNRYQEDLLRQVFGVAGVAALLSNTAKNYSKGSLAWRSLPQA